MEVKIAFTDDRFTKVWWVSLSKKKKVKEMKPSESLAREIRSQEGYVSLSKAAWDIAKLLSGTKGVDGEFPAKDAASSDSIAVPYPSCEHFLRLERSKCLPKASIPIHKFI